MWSFGATYGKAVKKVLIWRAVRPAVLSPWKATTVSAHVVAPRAGGTAQVQVFLRPTEDAANNSIVALADSELEPDLENDQNLKRRQ